jgi:hypothetical protein
MESTLSYKGGSEYGPNATTTGEIFEKNLKIEGYVYLKRKQDWVKRYAIV